ncbi:serine/threonine-protein kinase [Prosthecobacter sp.]|uniref:serine/threonine-protein kinase n=1 Tax=Prosthecobacter sp. TaxID=1965333 RepID=UPI001D9586DA|nr:serine/threonine-protein kinase [Prosthecobacter sp.]MCB1276043.1 protein kinase [Prosthecobacter sp.]
MSQESPAQHQPPFDVPSVEEMAALLPQYAFEKLAAFGGMGAVYKAKQQSLDRPVAIKILPPEFGKEPEFAERFKAEARAMAKLNHTHIVGVIDFGLTKAGHLYLVMEWVQGPTLHELIHKGSLPVRKAAKLAMQLCEALTYAHNHKILHRDIKPGNIMVNEEEQVKVTDFGLARPITGEAEENPYGTPDYAAPEILGKGAVDQRADIFAAGVVLYEMLTGRVPQHPRRSVQEFAPLSTHWDELIDKATHPEPGKRFQEAGEFRAHIAMLIKQAAQPVAVTVVEVVEDEPASKVKAALKPLHLVMIVTAVILVGIVLGSMFKGEPERTKSKKKVVAETKQTTEEPEKKPKKPKPKADDDAKKTKEPVSAVPAPEPEMKTSEPEPAAKKMASVPATPEPVPMPAPKPEPVPAPETPLEAIQKLEERDPELARLVNAFADEWAANEDIDTVPEMQDLAGKYIPALQRSLAGLAPEQRDHILSEISHVANREPLNARDASWPAVLGTLRNTYEAQRASIQAIGNDAAQKMRSAQCELLLAKAKERAAAGNVEAAKRAEAVAAELAKLRTPPSLKALKENVAGTVSATMAPPTVAEPVR